MNHFLQSVHQANEETRMKGPVPELKKKKLDHHHKLANIKRKLKGKLQTIIS